MIGNLRHRVTLQIPVTMKDSIGQETERWQDLATVWASIEPLSGKEYFSAQQINSEISTKICIRYISGITANIRIVFKTRIYNILSVINFEERNKYLQLMCCEKVGEVDD